MSGRYEVRPLVLYGRSGYAPWDLELGREVEQPGRPHSHWTPSRERAEAWCRDNNAATPHLPANRKPVR